MKEIDKIKKALNATDEAVEQVLEYVNPLDIAINMEFRSGEGGDYRERALDRCLKGRVDFTSENNTITNVVKRIITVTNPLTGNVMRYTGGGGNAAGMSMTFIDDETKDEIKIYFTSDAISIRPKEKLKEEIYYEIRTYNSEEDFENRRFGILTDAYKTMEDALLVANQLLETEVTAVVKILSSDDEEIIILRENDIFVDRDRISNFAEPYLLDSEAKINVGDVVYNPLSGVIMTIDEEDDLAFANETFYKARLYKK